MSIAIPKPLLATIALTGMALALLFLTAPPVTFAQEESSPRCDMVVRQSSADAYSCAGEAAGMEVMENKSLSFEVVPLDISGDDATIRVWLDGDTEVRGITLSSAEETFTASEPVEFTLTYANDRIDHSDLDTSVMYSIDGTDMGKLVDVSFKDNDRTFRWYHVDPLSGDKTLLLEMVVEENRDPAARHSRRGG